MLRSDRHYAYFCNRECEYFPCHPTDNPEEFNCLFCYCHRPENYDAITARYEEIAAAMKRTG